MYYLVSWEAEEELLRLGNGGRFKSDRRDSLPIAIESKPLILKVSVAATPTLGALLGRDFIKALGLVSKFFFLDDPGCVRDLAF